MEKDDKEPKPITFTMKMSKSTRRKLEDLAANETFKYNNSAVINYLIVAEHIKNFKTNEQVCKKHGI